MALTGRVEDEAADKREDEDTSKGLRFDGVGCLPLADGNASSWAEMLLKAVIVACRAVDTRSF